MSEITMNQTPGALNIIITISVLQVQVRPLMSGARQVLYYQDSWEYQLIRHGETKAGALSEFNS